MAVESDSLSLVPLEELVELDRPVDGSVAEEEEEDDDDEDDEDELLLLDELSERLAEASVFPSSLPGQAARIRTADNARDKLDE